VGGTLDGNVHASERTELRKTAVVNGDVQTKRIAIEEGAYFKGKLENPQRNQGSCVGRGRRRRPFARAATRAR